MTEVFDVGDPAPCWDAWMRGTAGMGVDGIAATCPDLGPAADALERVGMTAFAREASSAVASSGDSAGEVAFLAFRMALQHVADGASRGVAYNGGIRTVAEALYGPASVHGMTVRALADMPGLMAPANPEGLAVCADALLELATECIGTCRDPATASHVSGMLSAGSGELIASCLCLETVDGFAPALERVSLVGLFGRLLAASMVQDGCRAISEGSVRAFARCIPWRWVDGTSVILEELYECMCAVSGARIGPAPCDLSGVYIDMSGCPGQ
ncbi:MAG: hypothetical protein Q4Q62_07655 [Thermoplasmata archaeon]|nr:hypothetical protein [Thermoplasmata archaeon]